MDFLEPESEVPIIEAADQLRSEHDTGKDFTITGFEGMI
jgi:hypothetical protein